MAITWLRLGFEKSQRSFLITYKTNVDKRSDVRRNTDWNFSPCYTTGNSTALVLVLVVLQTLMRSSEHKHIDGRQTDGKESSLQQTPLLSGRVNEHPCVENSKRPSLLPPPQPSLFQLSLRPVSAAPLFYSLTKQAAILRPLPTQLWNS